MSTYGPPSYEPSSNVRPLDGVRCIGYIRVSSDQQATDDRTSLADQRAAIRAKAASLGVEVGAWFEDAGYSGTTVEKRPDFSAMLASCRAQTRTPKSPGFVLALNDSRFGRFADPADSLHLMQDLKHVGWLVRFCEGDDIADGVGRGVARLVSAAQAGEYIENLRRNTKRGKRGAAAKGFWTGKATLGYLRKVCWPPNRAERVLADGEHKAKDEHVKLTPNLDGSAEFIAEFFQLYASGTYSTKSLAEWARQRYPERWWDSATVYDILRRRTYLGEIAYDGGVYENGHPALVSHELFDRVQRRLRANASAPRSSKYFYVLTNLVLCERCGMPLIGGGTSKGFNYYRCRGGNTPGSPCYTGAAKVRAAVIEAWVREVLSEELARPAFQHAVIRALDAMVDRIEAESPAPRTDSIEATIGRLQKERDKMISLARRGSMTEDETDRELRNLAVLLADAESQKRQVLRIADHRARQAIDRQTLYRHVHETPLRIRDADPRRAREAVRLWVASATFEPTTRRLRVAIRPQIGEVWNDGLWGPKPHESTTAEIPLVIREVAFGRRRK